MGMHAAHSMAGNAEAGEQLFNLDLFTHVTRFLGHRIVLLGQYNGQRLQAEPDSDIVTYARSTEVRWAADQFRKPCSRLWGKTGMQCVQVPCLQCIHARVCCSHRIQHCHHSLQLPVAELLRLSCRARSPPLCACCCCATGSWEPC